MSSLSIGGLPICGAVGDGASITIATGDCWEAYHKWVTSFAEGAELCVLRRYAQWSVNGQEIEEPKTWFITCEAKAKEIGFDKPPTLILNARLSRAPLSGASASKRELGSV